MPLRIDSYPSLAGGSERPFPRRCRPLADRRRGGELAPKTPWRVALAILAAGLLTAAGLGAQPAPSEEGVAFSDPEVVFNMPAEWIERTVRHAPEDAAADLVIAVNQGIVPLLRPLIEEFAERARISVRVVSGTCGTSAGDLTSKAIDIGSFCCPPRAADRLPGLRFHTLGVTPEAFFVNAENPVDGVTLEELRGIFGGTLRRWSDLPSAAGSGPDRPIHPVARLHCKLRPGHWRRLLDHEDLFSDALEEVGSIADVFSVVAMSRWAIGFESLLEFRRRPEGLRLLEVDGSSPADLRVMLAGDYPLYRVFALTTWEPQDLASPHARELVDSLLDKIETLGPGSSIVPPSQLRQAGWRFRARELVGEPDP